MPLQMLQRQAGLWELLTGPGTPPDPPVEPPFVIGTTKPISSNTGCRIPRASLTVYNGDMTVTTAGAEITGYLITGQLFIRAADVWVHDNVVEARRALTSASQMIDTTHSAARRAIIENNTVNSSNYPNIYVSGIGPGSYTARRNNVKDVVDPFSIYDIYVGTAAGDDVRLEGNYAHDLFYLTPAVTHADNRTHNDGAQIQGGPSKVHILGNNIDARDSVLSTNGGGTNSLSCIMLNTTTSRYASNVDIHDNWLNGGGYSINGIGTNGGTISIKRNRFGADRDYDPIAINTTDASVWVVPTSGVDANVYEADGSLVDSTATFTSSGDTIRRYF